LYWKILVISGEGKRESTAWLLAQLQGLQPPVEPTLPITEASRLITLYEVDGNDIFDSETTSFSRRPKMRICVKEISLTYLEEELEDNEDMLAKEFQGTQAVIVLLEEVVSSKSTHKFHGLLSNNLHPDTSILFLRTGPKETPEQHQKETEVTQIMRNHQVVDIFRTEKEPIEASMFSNLEGNRKELSCYSAEKLARGLLWLASNTPIQPSLYSMQLFG
jgi:hypothetical protein